MLLAAPLVLASSRARRHSPDAADEATIVFDICMIVFLTLMAGLMSGLTLGLMSMDHVDLEVLKRSGTGTEKKHAERLSPLLQKQHLLLVTLLLFNAMAMEALPLFIDKLTNPATAVILAVTVVLLFGEIIPQAVCSRHGLAIGSYSTWLVRFLIILGFPVSWPISKLLDKLLGENHSALFRRGQLKALVDVHGAQSGMGGFLTKDEISVIRGALDLTNKLARVAMTSLDTAFTLSSDTVLNGETLARILRMGHSRVPVHLAGDRSQLLGVVLVKELVLLDPDDNVKVDSMRIRQVPFLPASIPMYDLLRLFQTGRSHMVFLRKPPVEEGGEDLPATRDVNVHGSHGTPPAPEGHVAVTIEHADPEDESEVEEISEFERKADVGDVVGIITIEDVIEELIGEEIVDETDTHVDNERKLAVNVTQQALRLPESLRSALKLDKMGRAQSMRPSGTMRRLHSNKPAPDIPLSRGNNGLGLPPGSHANALHASSPDQLRRTSTGRPPYKRDFSDTGEDRQFRRSYSVEGPDTSTPLISNGTSSDDGHHE